jgi:metal-sulfur cluster biosynthetic enzyme
MSLQSRVITALSEVYDPELDEPITSLRFISSCDVSLDGDVEIALRLPTPQCAPNFAFLMAADARRAVCRLPGVRGVVVRLEDHYTGDEINGALAADAGFSGAFPGETASEDLEGLRDLFLRKALVARQSRICELLLASGLSEEALCAMTISDLDESRDAVRCVELRVALGLTHSPSDPAFVLPNGWTLEVKELRRWLRTARLIRTSLEANGGMCRSLLAHRYQLDERESEEVPAR